MNNFFQDKYNQKLESKHLPNSRLPKNKYLFKFLTFFLGNQLFFILFSFILFHCLFAFFAIDTKFFIGPIAFFISFIFFFLSMLIHMMLLRIFFPKQKDYDYLINNFDLILKDSNYNKNFNIINQIIKEITCVEFKDNFNDIVLFFKNNKLENINSNNIFKNFLKDKMLECYKKDIFSENEFIENLRFVIKELNVKKDDEKNTLIKFQEINIKDYTIDDFNCEINKVNNIKF